MQIVPLGDNLHEMLKPIFWKNKGKIFQNVEILTQGPVVQSIDSLTSLLVVKMLTVLILIVLGFNDTSTLVGHFVSSPREREKRDRRDSRRDEREGQGRKRNRNESGETEEIKTSPPYPYLLQG